MFNATDDTSLGDSMQINGSPTVTMFNNGNFLLVDAVSSRLIGTNGTLLGGRDYGLAPAILPGNDFVVVDGTYITVFDGVDGSLLGGHNLNSPFSRPANMASLNNGNVIVIDYTCSCGQIFNSQLTAIDGVFQIGTGTIDSYLYSSLQSSDYLLIFRQTTDRSTHIQTYYVGTNLRLVNADQQLNYLQDGPTVAFNNITILTEYNTANATLTLSDPQAGVLTTSILANVNSSFIPQEGIWEAVGDVNAVNALLAEMQFIPAANYDRNFTVALNIMDEGSRTANGTLALVGIPTPPVLQNNTLTIEEGQSVLLQPQFTGDTRNAAGNFYHQ